MTSRLARSLGLLQHAAVFALLAAVFLSRVDRVTFHCDESEWVYTSRYFEALVSFDFTAATWDRNRFTLLHPPMARYFAGLGRRLAGFKISDLNPPWRYDLGDADNRKVGTVPGPRLLHWARLPMALLAALSGWLMFMLVRDAAGRTAGVCAAVLFAFNPLFFLVLPRAMTEAPLLFFVCLAVLAGAVGARASPLETTAGPDTRERVRFIGRAAMTGVLCGMAGASKLNGLSAAAGAALLFAAAAAGPAAAARGRRGVIGATAVAAVVAGTMIAFIGVNPFLYRDTSGALRGMLDRRLRSIDLQLSVFPKVAIQGPGRRMSIVPERALHTWMAPKFPLAPWLNGAVCAAGAAVLARKSLKWFRGTERSAAAPALLAIGLASALPGLATPLDWDRYYALPVLMTVVFTAAAAGPAAAVLRLAFKWTASPRRAKDA